MTWYTRFRFIYARDPTQLSELFDSKEPQNFMEYKVHYWKKLESKVSQKEKIICYILMQMQRIWKDGVDEVVCKAGIDRQT